MKRYILAEITKILFVLFVIIGLVVLLVNTHISFVDWMGYWRQVAESYMEDPYIHKGIMNPPWTYVIIYPFTFLPLRYDVALFEVVSITIIYQYLRQDIFRFACVATSASFFGLINSGQLEGLVILGMMVSWGLPLIVIKPQAAIFTGLLKLNRQSLSLMIVVLLGSFLIWGFWPERVITDRSLIRSFDESFFPYGLPFVPILMLLGVHFRSYALLCLASLCFSPYWVINSSLPFVVAFVRETNVPVLWVIVSALSWLIVLT